MKRILLAALFLVFTYGLMLLADKVLGVPITVRDMIWTTLGAGICFGGLVSTGKK